MILGDAKSGDRVQTGSAGWTTLDDLFRRAATRRPDALALVDPSNRESITGDQPRRLTYAQADSMISAIAARLRRIGLSTDDIVAIQLPNIVESILVLLAVLRAGMIATPLPLLWRREDCVTALSRIGAKALIICGRAGATDHGKLAIEIAAETFSIRSVCGFGSDLPDGVAALDDLFAAEQPDPSRLPQHIRMGNPAVHVAAVTWDVTVAGPVPVARNHVELLTGGLTVTLEARMAQDAIILATCPAASFAGIALSMAPWLFTGGTLVLHHAFDPRTLAAQISGHRCEFVVVPGPLLPRISVAGLLSPQDGVKMLLSLWRSPERLAASAPWRRADMTFEANVGLVDILAFGEIGLIAARRGMNGKPAPIGLGPVTAPRGAQGALQIAEISQTVEGCLAIRGPMVPRRAFPPGAEKGGVPHFRIADSGYVDTGYPCRIDQQTRAVIVTAPPAGLVHVGGYRFPMRELHDAVARAEPSATLAALPDAFAGYRLAGQAPDRRKVREALVARGANPLILRAFRDRGEPPAAS